MKDFILVSVRKPILAFNRLFQHEKKVSYSFFLLLLLGTLYTITVIIGYLNGFGAVLHPLLNIKPEDYYYYEAFFCIPVFILIAIIFGGLTRLLSMIMRGQGSFEKNFVVYCTSSFLPTIVTMWLPETVLIVFFPDHRATPLGGFRMLPIWADAARQISGILWPLIISIIGINGSEKIGITKSSIVTILAFLVCASVMMVFIR